MYMSLKTISRVTLLHLSLNPLLSIPVRASTTTSNLAHAPSQSPNLRSFSGLYPLCPSYNLYQNTIYNHNQEHTYSTSSTMSSENQNQPQEQEQKPILALPEAGSDTQTNTLDLSAEGGSTVKLDHLGPLVVNQDGTLSRISNWAQMTEIEQRNTLRVLGKRNKSRMEALKKAAAEDEVKAGEGN